MPDVFISYARSTQATAQTVSEALRALGYDVWLDEQLPAHRAYADVIEEQLRAAKSVVVIWSADAARSEWVRSEAELARQARKLVQVRVDQARLPMPFDQIQCADLTGWTGQPETPAWRPVVASIAALVAAATPAATEPGAAPAADRPAEPSRADYGAEAAPEDRQRRAASLRADAKIRFRTQAIRFAVGITALAAINLVTSPHELWFQYALIGWGLGLAYYGLKTFQTVAGEDRESVIARELARMRGTEPPPR